MVAIQTLIQPTKEPKQKEKTQQHINTLQTSFADFLQQLNKKGVILTPKNTTILPQKDSQQKESSLKEDFIQLLQTPAKEKTQQQTITLESLLKGDANSPTLTNEITQNLSITELKYLIYKAKQYLKQQITQTPQFQKSNLSIKDLPNTLKSLLKIAQKFGIKINNISYQNLFKPPLEKQSQDIPLQKTTKSQQTITQQFFQTPTKEKEVIQSITTKLSTIQNNTLFQTKKTTITTKELLETKTKKTIQKTTTTSHSNNITLLESLLQNNTKETPQKNIDLFTLSNMQQTKQNTINIIPQQKQEKNLFNEEINNLETLLKGENVTNNPSIQSNNNTLTIKMHEAKQMMKYLSYDIKKSIEEYKPPFSRLKVQLHPQKLGEIDLTVIQRGNNVHINLSSNNAAINILTSNLTELKTQLTQTGINNASFNFNSNTQSDQQQNQRSTYEYFAKNEDEKEEQSLEIIIPQYV